MKKLILAATCAALVLVACKKEEDNKPNRDYTSVTDNARAEDVFSDMLAQVDKAVLDNGLRELCDPIVSFDTTASPRTITLDFGDVNCTALSGRLRRGRVQVSYTGRYREPGTVITITPENYFVNNNRVQGSKTVTNLGTNADGHLHYSIVVSGTLTAGDGSWTATHQANRTRTWVAGEATLQLSDDVYLITGNGSGVNRNGGAYSLVITSPLRVALDCAWITQGTVEVTPQGLAVRTFDYGDGTCDGTFTVSVGGATFTVNIG